MTRFVAMTAIFLPFLEIPAFVLVSHWIGVIPALVLVVGGVVCGILVLRQVGLNAVVSLRLALARGEEPGHTLIDAACFALAGFLLTVPGFISDLMALALFMPWTRNYLLRRVARHFDTHVHVQIHPGVGPGFGMNTAPDPRSDVIDGEYSVVEPDAPRIDQGLDRK
jgi:UPF0716 protein FxsA